LEQSDVVIIGGSAAGVTAAISCKRRYPGKTVTLIRKEEQVLIPCGITVHFWYFRQSAEELNGGCSSQEH